MEERCYSVADARADAQLIMSLQADALDVACLSGRGEIDAEGLEGLREHVDSFSKLARFVAFAEETLLPGDVRGVGMERAGHVEGQRAHVSVPEVPLAPMQFADMLPVTMTVGDGTAEAAVDERQLHKDVSRDRFLVQGSRVVGAESGLDGIMRCIDVSMRRMCDEMGLPAPNPGLSMRMCHLALTALNRTNSSGIALETLQSSLMQSAVLLPLSDTASPLAITVRFGRVPVCSEAGAHYAPDDTEGAAPALSAWGLLLSLRGSAVFRVLDGTDDGVDGTAGPEVEAVYMQEVCAPFVGGSPTGAVVVPSSASVHFATLRR